MQNAHISALSVVLNTHNTWHIRLPNVLKWNVLKYTVLQTTKLLNSTGCLADAGARNTWTDVLPGPCVY